MKPFVAVTVLVAASLTAASAASVQQQLQQLAAAGSRGGARGQRPASSGGLQFPGGLPGLAGVWSNGPTFSGGLYGSAPFWVGHVAGAPGSGFGANPSSSSSSSAGAAGSRPGSFQGQVSSVGIPAPVVYHGAWGQSRNYPGQLYGQSPIYGNGANWGVGPAQWGWTGPLYGSGYGYGGGYGGANPFGFYYAGHGLPSHGNAQGSTGLGQTALRVASQGSSVSSSQRPAARSQ